MEAVSFGLEENALTVCQQGRRFIICEENLHAFFHAALGRLVKKNGRATL
jgi:hypothetical protein